MNSRRKFLASAILGVGGAVALPLSKAKAMSVFSATAENTYADVTGHQVIGDGLVKNTQAINALIARLHEQGGGTLHFPAGTYLTGPIHFKSNITLHLDAGAVIRFSDDFDDYLPMVPSRWQGLPVTNFSPLLYAYKATNIAITGRGVIDGSGPKWWNFIYTLRNAFRDTGVEPDHNWRAIFYQHNEPGEDQSHGFMRPSLFQAIESENILIHGVHFTNSPFWTIHFVECTDVVVDSISIHNERSPNTDGINPESSKNVRISNCNINASDDCITIKAGKGAWGRKHAKPCENITVTNCMMTSGAAGVAIGSEVSGDVRRVVVSNCVFDGTGNGIHIKTNRERGGIIEDVVISNIVMNNIQRHPGIFINMKYWIQTDPQPIGEATPRVRNIQISNITGTNIKRAIGLIGLEEMPMENVRINQVHIESDEGFVCENAQNVRLRDISIDCKSGIPFVFSDSGRIEMNGLRATPANQGIPVISMHNVQKAAISGVSAFDPEQLHVAIEGKKTKDIIFEDQRLLKNKKAIRVSADIGKGMVR